MKLSSQAIYILKRPGNSTCGITKSRKKLNRYQITHHLYREENNKRSEPFQRLNLRLRRIYKDRQQSGYRAIDHVGRFKAYVNYVLHGSLDTASVPVDQSKQKVNIQYLVEIRNQARQQTPIVTAIQLITTPFVLMNLIYIAAG